MAFRDYRLKDRLAWAAEVRVARVSTSDAIMWTPQDRTYRKLNLLTIVQAAFVPSALIAGIYGMNFDRIPELHPPNAYFICLGVMAAIVAGELFLFSHRGWFSRAGSILSR